MKIIEVVLAKVHAIQQDLSFGGIVKPGNQFDDCRLALAVFANQRQPLIWYAD